MRTVDWSPQVERYLSRLQHGDRSGALAVVQGMLERGHLVTDVVEHVLAPAQLRVGELWMSGRWSVAQEHAATVISEAVLASVATGTAAVEVSDGAGPTLMVSCVAHEWHALPAMMVAERLRADGFTVSYLGANLPTQTLVRHVQEIGPRAVLLSCSLSGYLPQARRQIEAVRETGTPVVVGGAAFGGDARRALRLGATAFAAHPAALADLVASLPAAVTPAPAMTHPGAEEAFVVFGEREDLADALEQEIVGDLASGATSAWREALRDQLPHVVSSVAGALVCDDVTIVSESLAWTRTVLEHRGAPARFTEVLEPALARVLRGLPACGRLLRATPDGD